MSADLTNPLGIARALDAFYDRAGNKWVQRALARDENNFTCSIDDADACGWCAVGALCVLAGVGMPSELPPVVDRAADELGRLLVAFLPASSEFPDTSMLVRANDRSESFEQL